MTSCDSVDVAELQDYSPCGGYTSNLPDGLSKKLGQCLAFPASEC